MDKLDTSEWLLTNGLGGFASGTVCDIRSRKYHGWLIAAIEPPGQRKLLLSHLEASLEIAGQVYALGTNSWAEKIEPWGYQLLRSFTIAPVPTWIWGEADWQLMRQIIVPHALSSEPESADFGAQAIWGARQSGNGNDLDLLARQRLLVRYHYQGSEAAILRLRPLIADRDFHQQQKQAPNLSFSQLVGPRQVLLQALQAGTPGTPWQLRWTQGHYYPDEVWYWSFYYPEEAKRGLDCLEDLYSPGYLSIPLRPDDRLLVEARVGLTGAHLPLLDLDRFDAAIQAEQQRLTQLSRQARSQAGQGPLSPLYTQLLRASDSFIVYQSSLTAPRIIAGYHWFGDRSRETLLCLPGLLLAPKRFLLARRLLQRLGQLCCQGLLPNVIPDSGAAPVFRSIDCSLWWVETLGLYLEASQDWDFLAEQYEVVKQIYKAFTAGTLHNIRVDASDGLVTWDDDCVALTWMDAMANEVPVTPRQGKPIEVNALWYSTLCWASQWALRLADNLTATNVDRLQNQARRYTEQAEQVKQSLQKYWNPRLGYFYDRIEPDDRLDPTVRPNAVIALSLQHCGFTTEQARQGLQIARDRLLTPYGLRSLDPADPEYIGCYQGSPQQRDLAAHQGTVWSWLLGSFIRAWRRFYDPSVPLPVDLQPLLDHFEHQVCSGGISEMFDGNAPHTPRGTIAHAGAIAELLRRWDDLLIYSHCKPHASQRDGSRSENSRP